MSGVLTRDRQLCRLNKFRETESKRAFTDNPNKDPCNQLSPSHRTSCFNCGKSVAIMSESEGSEPPKKGAAKVTKPTKSRHGSQPDWAVELKTWLNSQFAHLTASNITLKSNVKDLHEACDVARDTSHSLFKASETVIGNKVTSLSPVLTKIQGDQDATKSKLDTLLQNLQHQQEELAEVKRLIAEVPRLLEGATPPLRHDNMTSSCGQPTRTADDFPLQALNLPDMAKPAPTQRLQDPQGLDGEEETLRARRKALGAVLSNILDQVIGLIKQKNFVRAKVLQAKAQRKFKEVERIHARLQQLLTYNEVDDRRYDAICETYDTIEGEYVAGTTTSESQSYSRKLPPLQKQTFKGEHTKWESWFANYNASIHNNPKLATVEKFNYLLEMTEGPARKQIEGFEFTNENYEAMLKILKDVYGRKDVIIRDLMAEITTLQKPNTMYDRQNMRNLLDSARRIHRQLTSLNQPKDSYELAIRTRVMEVIPGALAFQWRNAWDNEPETYDMVVTALERAVRSLEAQGVRDKQSDSSTQRNNGGSQDPSKYCPFCLKYHNGFECLAKTLKERILIIDKDRKCRTCLRQGHKNVDCKSGRKCDHCGHTNHASNLCYAKHAPKEENPSAGLKPQPTIKKKVEIKGTTQGCARTEYTLIGKRTPGVDFNIDWEVLLPTMTVKLIDAEGKAHQAVGMLDSGSQRSFITTKMAKQLRWPVRNRIRLMVHGFGNTNQGEKELNIRCIPAKGLDDKPVRLELLEQPELATVVATGQICLAKKLADEGYILADPDQAKHGHDTRPVDFIIGMDQYYSVVKLDSLIGENQMAATKTIFGWVVGGLCKEIHNLNNTNSYHSRENQPTKETAQNDVLGDFRQFWSLEHMGVLEVEETQPTFEEQYISSLTRKEDGRFVANLPWKENKGKLPTNHTIAVRRLRSLLASLNSRVEQREEYHNQIMGYLKDGFITEVDPEFNGTYTYLPHRAVYRHDAASTKCRPVFDGSAHFKGSPSINECLEVGPNLNPEILAVLIRNRCLKIAFLADIAKAFLQIELGGADAHAVRFLWVKDPCDKNSPIVKYRWLRVPFGLTSSPFILRAVIKRLLDGYKTVYPATVNQLEAQLYVDDWIGGAHNVEEAAQFIREALEIFQSAKMELCKWSTNSEELKSKFDQLEFSNELTALCRMDIAQDGSKALGVHWDQKADQFIFRPDKILDEIKKYSDNPTKRQVFSIALKVFDPLGIVSPVILVAKLIMQKLWASKTGWDQPIPKEILTSWKVFVAGLKDLDLVRIDRWVGIEDQPTELQVFSDASEDAYATAIYVLGANGPRLLVSKTRIAPQPKKSTSIPRLELLSNLLAARLTSYVTESTKGRAITARAWTDSTVAMHWIKGESGRWKQFVHNRVVKIREVFSPDRINHCPGLENPADLASRGTSTTYLATSQFWWQGPHWLSKPTSEWPEFDQPEGEDTPEEVWQEAITPHTTINLMIGEEMDLFKRYDRMDKLCRIVAWIKRFKNNCLKIKLPKSERTPIPFCKIVGKRTTIYALTVGETIEARLTCIRMAQANAYPKEYMALLTRKEVERTSDLYVLRPIWDNKHQLIRVTGRVANAYKVTGKQPPILLPAKHTLTTLLIRSLHLDLLHSGVSTMMVKFRRTYFTTSLRSTLKKVVNECVQCRKFDARCFNNAPALLPIARVSKGTPFGVTGVDFAGPLKTIEEKTTTLKHRKHEVHICLFTCAVTRAVHLEVVSNLQVETFLFALRRFIARRGIPRIMYSDNATTFHAAAQHLRTFKESQKVVDYLNGIDLRWRFSASLAPWWGGFWERMIQTVKKSMFKTLGREVLTLDQFVTLTTEIEGVVNSRPLTYVLEDELDPITPAKLLSGQIPRDELSLDDDDPEIPPLSKVKHLRQIELARREVLKNWWKLWGVLYLAELKRLALKAGPTTSQIQKGQVVLIHEDRVKRLNWQMGRVVKLCKGKDGKVRQVKLINVKNNTLTRPIQRLYPLEAHAGQIDDHPDEEGIVFPPEGTPFKIKKTKKSVPKTKGQASATALPSALPGARPLGGGVRK